MSIKRASGFALAMLLIGVAVAAAQSDADRIGNIRKAASDIAELQNAKGADSTFAAIKSCYGRETPLVKSLSRGLEYCMTQDILASQAAAGLLSRISAEARKKNSLPEPTDVAKAMAERVTNTYARFRISVEEGRKFQELVKTHGTEAYVARIKNNSTRNKK